MNARAPLYRQLTSIVVAMSIIGLFLSKILLSASFILLLILAIVWLVRAKGRPLRRNLPPFLAISLIFFIILLSCLKGGDPSYMQDQIVMKLPFLAVPLAMFILPGIRESQFQWLVFLFGTMALATGLYTFSNYLLNMQEIHREMLVGRGFPNPANEHIRYSLFLCMGVASWAYLLIDDFMPDNKWFQILAWSSIGFLVLLVHIMSVRSGWLALYLLGFFFMFRYLILSKKYHLGLLLLAGILTAPIIAYRTIESVQNKINYMVYDLKMTRAGQLDGLNDARRITSIKVGLELGNSSPLTGVGIGHLKERTDQYYLEHFPQMTDPWGRKLPHNQFVWFYAATGMLGLGFFAFALAFPFFYKKAYKHPLMMSLYLVVGSSLMTEASFGRQLGIALFLIFVTLIWNERKAVSHHHNL